MKIEKHCGLHCTRINNISVTIGKQIILENVNIHIHCGELTESCHAELVSVSIT